MCNLRSIVPRYYSTGRRLQIVVQYLAVVVLAIVLPEGTVASTGKIFEVTTVFLRWAGVYTLQNRAWSNSAPAWRDVLRPNNCHARGERSGILLAQMCEKAENVAKAKNSRSNGQNSPRFLSGQLAV